MLYLSKTNKKRLETLTLLDMRLPSFPLYLLQSTTPIPYFITFCSESVHFQGKKTSFQTLLSTTSIRRYPSSRK